MKFLIRIAGLLAGFIVTGATTVAYYNMPAFRDDSKVFDEIKLMTLDQIVGWQYFKESQYQDRIEGLYAGYISGLGDSMTRYLTAEDASKWLAEDNGKYVGNGIKFTWGITSQYLVVTEVLANSPAFYAGIEVGDRITMIDGIYAMMSNELDIYSKLLYAGEDEVVYTIIKVSDENKVIEVPLKSIEIETEALNCKIFEDSIGYIEFVNFSEGANNILQNHIEEMSSQGVSSWIFDMRYLDNTDFDEIIEFTNFLKDDGLMFKSINNEGIVTLYNADAGKFEDEIVIITNSQTSGTIEALIASVKDDDAITIMGTSTDGVASIQQFVQLEDGSGLLISSQKILLEDGTIIGEEPIQPEILVELTLDYTLKLVTEGISDISLDNQINEAIKYLQEKIS